MELSAAAHILIIAKDHLTEYSQGGTAVGLLLAQAALNCQESRVTHCRLDFPEKSPAYEKHPVLVRDPLQPGITLAFAE